MRVENSFIPVHGVGERTERRLWRRGITHWDAFEPTELGPRTARRVEAFIDTARGRLAAGDATFFAEALPTRSRWRLYENFRESTVFLDIETTGLSQRRHDVTVVSLHDAAGTETLVRGRDLTRERLCRALDGAALLVTYNGKRFDVPFLERAFDLPIDVPHLDLLYPCRRLDLTGGLKVVERTLGVDRDEPDISGRDAVRLWRRHEAGDEAALETLIRYNRDDTVNLRAVTEA
ncbi:MAG: ribonuclease H-like domain-containing protein, partial [Halobacteriales archaeon]